MPFTRRFKRTSGAAHRIASLFRRLLRLKTFRVLALLSFAFLLAWFAWSGPNRAGVVPPPFSGPGPGDRVLVLAPRPDDEALACGGVIRQALKRGAEVRVVVATSGEAFSVVARNLYPNEAFTPGLFIKLGATRIRESRRALAQLGLPPSHSPYSIGRTSVSVYSGQSLLTDLETALRTFRPTYLFYPHPGDFNRDHRGPPRRR